VYASKAYGLVNIREEAQSWNNDGYQQKTDICYFMGWSRDTSMASNASSPYTQLRAQIIVYQNAQI